MNRTGRLKFQCGMCTFSTDDERAFANHYSDQHKREMAYWCRECGRTSPSVLMLIDHIKNHCTKIKSVTMRCGVANCSYSGNDPFQFMQHIKIVHKGTHLFPCSKCRKLFTIPSCLIQHIQTECAQDDKGTPPPPNLARPRNSDSPKVAESSSPVFKKTYRDYHKRKSRNLFGSNDTDSDPDDPTWRVGDEEEGSKRNTAADLQSDIEIHSSASETNHQQRTAKNTETTETVEPRKENNKVAVSQFAPQRYERWNDWWKAVSNCKTPGALLSQLKEENLKHFFSCMSKSCHYSTDDQMLFAKHQSREHSGQKLPCRYCLREIDAGSSMACHSVSIHGTRRHQCSRCFYRASTKPQVALHYEAMHGGKPVIFACKSFGPEPEVAENAETEVPMPYICRVGRCVYETCNPEEFVDHNKNLHVGVSVYPCFYCGAETFKLDALMRHYRLHGIYNFQCAHCVHGTNTIEDILFHQCLNHAERRMQVYVRPSTRSKNSNDDSSSQPENDLELPNCPESCPDYDSNFRCGVEGCSHVLLSLVSYREHLLASHHCNSFFPCPHCTAISVTAADLEDHLSMHGPNMYACCWKDCTFCHWKKTSVENHCKKNHGTLSLAVIRENEYMNVEIKKEPEEIVEETPLAVRNDSDESRINFQLQLHGSISVQGNVKSTCTFSSDIPEEPQAKRLKKSKSCLEAEEALFICPFCKFSSATKDAIKDHLYEELDFCPFQCNLCDIKEVSPSHMREHIASVHPHNTIMASSSYSEIPNANLNLWITSYIGKGPTGPRKLVQNCTSKDVCNMCGVVVEQDLKRHLANHIEYKPHACIVCHERFFDREEARGHAVALHNTLEGDTFATLFPIARIERWLQETQREEENGSWYRCYYCSFGPSRLKALNDHLAKSHPNKRWRIKKRKSSKLAEDRIVPCEKCGHLNILKKRSKKDQEFPKEGSSYGKKPKIMDLTNIWVVPPQSLESPGFRIPVEDLMKLMNFNFVLQVPELKKTLYNSVV